MQWVSSFDVENFLKNYKTKIGKLAARQKGRLGAFFIEIISGRESLLGLDASCFCLVQKLIKCVGRAWKRDGTINLEVEKTIFL